jgi:transcription factor E2F4/5
MQQSIRNITDDVENCHLAYVTHEDICKCFQEDTMLAIQAPSGTELEVPLVEQVCLNLHILKYIMTDSFHILSHSMPTVILPYYAIYLIQLIVH